jgi:hypothetical protein
MMGLAAFKIILRMPKNLFIAAAVPKAPRPLHFTRQQAAQRALLRTAVNSSCRVKLD